MTISAITALAVLVITITPLCVALTRTKVMADFSIQIYPHPQILQLPPAGLWQRFETAVKEQWSMYSDRYVYAAAYCSAAAAVVLPFLVPALLTAVVFALTVFLGQISMILWKRRIWMIHFEGKGGPPSPALNGKIYYFQKVYENDSKNFRVELAWQDYQWLEESHTMFPAESGAEITLELARMLKSDPTVEVELQAAGITLAPGATITHKLIKNPTRYDWNCFFSNSGRHTVNLIFKQKSGKQEHVLATHALDINVFRFWFFTKRQLQACAIMGFLLSVALARNDILPWLEALAKILGKS